MGYDVNEIISHFDVEGELSSCEPYGEGHINHSYLIETKKDGGKKQYILQKINNKVFPNVEGLMNNIKLVTEFNRKKVIENGGNPDRESLTIIDTLDGKTYYYCKECDSYFRVYKFITDAVAYQVVEKPEHFYYSAVAFGNFAKLLAEFDATKLYEVIPNFHNTVVRFANFKKSLTADKLGRAKSVQKEIKFVLEREKYCDRIVKLLESGEMPTKVTHNDTKLNNVLLDKDTGKPVAVIDLDTIMAGSICYDFGDSIRFGCKTGTEDEKDLSKVNFDLSLFNEYVKGYCSSLGDSITKIEKDNLAFSAILITYECGMRFLADYLDGDVYFQIKREEHNLDRARTQFKLVEDMEKAYDKMVDIVNKY